MIEITIPQYIRKVKLSNSRMKKYYEVGKKLPTAKKYSDSSKYKWDKVPGFKNRVFLVDIATNERVIANPKSYGTPKWFVINGQKLYNNEIVEFVRNKVMSEIKDSFAPYFKDVPCLTEKDYPLNIVLEIHDTIQGDISKNLWDLDNRAWPYVKAFQDCLTGNKDRDGDFRSKKIIMDDNILCITRGSTQFIPVQQDSDRKLVFKISKETDSRVLNNKLYNDKFRILHNTNQQDLEEGYTF